MFKFSGFHRVERGHSRSQRWAIHPQSFGQLVAILRPSQAVHQIAEGDESSRSELVNDAFLACRSLWVRRQGAAFEVDQFVGQGASPMDLLQSFAQPNLLAREAGQPPHLFG
ncbi:Uncharacterised protein [Mycobacteroides abscessus subsp. abscessus]|nr:Uncharacterised protein [Mycobacteroides abscessus subsp. abscessus]